MKRDFTLVWMVNARTGVTKVMELLLMVNIVRIVLKDVSIVSRELNVWSNAILCMIVLIMDVMRVCIMNLVSAWNNVVMISSQT